MAWCCYGDADGYEKHRETGVIVKQTQKQILISVSIWPFVALILLPVAFLSVWEGYRNHADTLMHEYRVLEENSRVRAEHISGSIRIINQILASVRHDLIERRQLSIAEQSQLLRSYLKDAPEVRNIVVVNGQGRVQSEAKDISIGQDVSSREYFLHHQKAPGDDAPYFAKPFVSKAGNLVVTVSRVIRGENGSFMGVVLASYNDQFLDAVLKQPVNEMGFGAVLINRQGDIIAIVPHSGKVGKNLANSVAYSEHFSSFEKTTRHQNRSPLDQIERVSVYTNISDSPFTVIVSTELPHLLADWFNQLYGRILSFIFFTLAIVYLARVVAQRQDTITAAWQDIASRDSALYNFKSIVAASQDAVIGCDLKGQISTWNHGAESVFGYLEQEIIGKSIDQLVPEDRRQELKVILARLERGELISNFETQRFTKSGEVVDIEATISPMFDEDREVTGAAVIARDVTEKKAYEKRLSYVASHDRLTGLPNRELFYDRLSQAISMARRNRYGLAVMFIDLDGFKAVNDAYGHALGDETLKVTAQRLNACFRDTDTVARLGGDEFAVILTEIQPSVDVGQFAMKAIQSIGLPMTLRSGKEYSIGASIGIALFPEAGNEIDSLIQVSDNAMYESKHRGKNCYTFAKQIDPEIADGKSWINITDTLKVGFSEIDNQHQQLADLLNQLNANLVNSTPQTTVLQQLNAIVAYVGFHFDTEDRLMVQSNYPDTEYHRQAHEHLLLEMKHLKNRFSQGGELSVLQSLKDWFVRHINTADKALGQFLSSQT
jgi:diguanylate cyclase (GGDEF)-like protein/hemerythrin-like metal-binding protein/PAS domain S-box-containing protein